MVFTFFSSKSDDSSIFNGVVFSVVIEVANVAELDKGVVLVVNVSELDKGIVLVLVSVRDDWMCSVVCTVVGEIG
jgi:hypothetical protein